MPELTADEFMAGYAGRSGVTVEWLREQGQVAKPCDCGEEGCQGWQMRDERAWELEQAVLDV